MKEVKHSSNIEAHDHKDGTLTIRFKGGSTYDYPDFPADLYAKLDKAHEDGESVGKFFHQKIRNHFTGKKRETEK